MIQFNLLPDVKKEYVRAKRTKRIITTVALLSSGAAIAVTVLMFSFVNVAQKKHINDLTTDIETLSSDIASTENLDRILTVQNQLSLLPALHSSKPETSRLFDFVTFVSPAQIKVASLNMDAAATTIEISGTADSIATVNKFADNLKTVKYFTDDIDNLSAPFSQVLTDLSGDNTQANFKMTLVYDPFIFENSTEVALKLGDNISLEIDGSTDSGEES